MSTEKGCYGSVICNNSKSETCQQCSLALACYELVKENTSKIKERLEVDVTKQERRHHQRDVESETSIVINVVKSAKRERLTPYQQAIVDNPVFPLKARKLAASVFRKGMTGKYLINILKSGTNPFSNSTPALLDIACQLLMRGELSKQTLRTAFLGAGQSEKTALSQAHTAINCLLLLSVIDSKLKLRGDHDGKK